MRITGQGVGEFLMSYYWFCTLVYFAEPFIRSPCLHCLFNLLFQNALSVPDKACLFVFSLQASAWLSVVIWGSMALLWFSSAPNDNKNSGFACTLWGTRCTLLSCECPPHPPPPPPLFTMMLSGGPAPAHATKNQDMRWQRLAVLGPFCVWRFKLGAFWQLTLAFLIILLKSGVIGRETAHKG